MSQSFYSIKRDNVCVGKVISDFQILTNGKDLDGRKMELGEFYPVRSMLYVPNSLGRAEDLLYSSPQYPIHKLCDDETCKYSRFMIINSTNMGKFLKAAGYPEDLDYLDVEGIRKKYFKRFYTTTHAEEFGMTEVDINTQIERDLYLKDIPNIEARETFKKLRKFQNFFGLRSEYVYSQAIQETPYEDIHKFFLPPEYFEILREFGDRSIFELWFGYADKMNAFKPEKEEGIVRSLKKYN